MEALTPRYLAMTEGLGRAFPGLDSHELRGLVLDVAFAFAARAAKPEDLPRPGAVYRYAWRRARDRARSDRMRRRREERWAPSAGESSSLAPGLDGMDIAVDAILDRIAALLPDVETRAALRLKARDQLTLHTLNAALAAERPGRPIDAKEFDQITSRLRMALRRNPAIADAAGPLCEWLGSAEQSSYVR